MRPFNLVRYFTAASLGIIALLAILTAWVFSRNLERNLTDEAALYAQDMSRTLNRAIFREFIWPQQNSGTPLDLGDPGQRRALNEVVTDRMEGMRILTVILFDRDGRIIYSNKPAYIGYRSRGNPGIAAARADHPASFLKRAELERSPLSPGHDLFETYSPFYELDPNNPTALQGEISGVLELYQDARPITDKIRAGRREILATTTAIMSLLFLLLFAIVRRGDLRIRTLTDALEQVNRGLEERVRERTGDSERARRRLEALFDGIADGISVIGTDFAVAQINSGIERLFGPPDPKGPAQCHARYAGREQPCENCPARRTLQSDARAEQRYRWQTLGGDREVEVTTFPFTTAEGTAGVIEVVRDVSERAELERQVIQAESLANLGGMAAGVAHEIRNPIGMITSSAQLLGRAEGLSDRDRELLRVVRDESARVERTISELVRFATPPRPSRAATELAPLLEQVQQVLRPEAEQRKIELEIAIAAGLPRIFVDAELLHRALTNLVLNAIQVQQSGGSVRVEASRGEARTVQIRVVDRGPGVAQDDMERIFQPFFSRRAGGTGLGLSIVQRIVAANGGCISIASGTGGTMFTLSFDEAAA